ncbi:MAG TPA: SAM-dependent methyltransferase, partial [Methanomicrobiales archaeon]|nr:SAM-dependent methyltransferase [Methanomicrobiales archaeon]
MEQKSGCLICGRDLEYLEEPVTLSCYYCGEESTTDVRCVEGHYVCDRCHRLSAEDLIEEYCLRTTAADPLEIALAL